MQRLTDNPLDAERVMWLAKVAQFLGNMPQRQAALGALSAIGRAAAPEVDKELQRPGSARVERAEDRHR